MRTRLRGRQLLCPLEPRVGAFVYRNAGKVCLIIQSHLKVKSNTFLKSFIVKVTLEPCLLHLTHHSSLRLQNSPYFFVFKYARVVNKRSGTRLKTESETLTARFTDFFTDLEKKNDCFAVYSSLRSSLSLP